MACWFSKTTLWITVQENRRADKCFVQCQLLSGNAQATARGDECLLGWRQGPKRKSLTLSKDWIGLKSDRGRGYKDGLASRDLRTGQALYSFKWLILFCKLCLKKKKVSVATQWSRMHKVVGSISSLGLCKTVNKSNSASLSLWTQCSDSSEAERLV